MPNDPSKPVGPILIRNLHRLGFADIAVRCGEIAERVAKKTGKKVSRQRISAITKAAHIEPDTLKWLAKGLGVSPKELTRDE